MSLQLASFCFVSLALVLAPVSSIAADVIGELKAGLASKEPDQQMDAVTKVAELGPIAAPLTGELVRLLPTKDLALKVEVITALGEIGEGAGEALAPLRTLTRDPSVLVRHAAWTAIRQMAPASRAAAPDLDHGLEDPELVVRLAAAHATMMFDPGTGPHRIVTAMRVLADALKQDSAATCREAAQSLSLAGPLGVPVLLDTVKSGTPAAQLAALEGLANLGADAQPAIPAVLSLRSGGNAALAAAQARTLAAIAPDAKAVVPVLTVLSKHDSVSVRVASVSALGTYPGAADATIPLLIGALKDPEVSVRLAAVSALAAHGESAKAAVPALDAALNDSQGAVTIRAAEALAMIGPAAIPALIKRIDDPHFAELALQTIGQIGPAAKSATATLVQKLSQPGKLSVRELCLTLAFIEADPAVAGPALQKVAKDEKSPARAPAIFALGRIGDKSALKLITNAVEDNDPVVRLGAAWALLQFDNKNPDYIAIAVPRLAQGLERPDPRVRRLAAETLSQLGPAAAAAVPALAKRITDDEEPTVRISCAMALAQTGEAGRSAVPALVQFLQTEPSGGRRAALFALGSLGPVAVDALPAIQREALQGPLFDRTLAAWAALKVRADQQQINQMVPVLLTRLTREQPEAIVQMVSLLGELQHGRDEIDKFLTAMKQMPDQRVREAAEAALKKSPRK